MRINKKTQSWCAIGATDQFRSIIRALCESFGLPVCICINDKTDPKDYLQCCSLGAELGINLVSIDEFYESIPLLEDTIIYVCRGEIIPGRVLSDMPDTVDIFNIHNSMLPHWRGVHPIPWAILTGEIECGVSIHRVTNIVDDGDIVAQKALRLSRMSHVDNVTESLRNLTSELVVGFHDKLISGKNSVIKNESPGLIEYARRRGYEDGQLRKSSIRLTDLIRLLRAQSYRFPPVNLTDEFGNIIFEVYAVFPSWVHVSESILLQLDAKNLVYKEFKFLVSNSGYRDFNEWLADYVLY